MSEPSNVVVETVGPIDWIRLNRPEMRNAIARDSAERVTEALRASERRGARVVVLTGSGGSFCSGADLKAEGVDLGDPSSIRSILVEAYHPLLLTMTRIPIPVVAAVDGIAAGIGCDLALAADLRLASARAAFSQIFVQVGLIPDGGGTFTLPRLVGMTRAMEMALTGRKVPADEALAWGMINHVFPTETFGDEVRAYVEDLATRAPLSMARSKQAIREACEAVTFERSLQREAELQGDLFASRDFVEGVTAFVEKRKPTFEGC
jgi:2-(1,2-epoxy-1,2-dihydrophenyl)acetyl-CoA isomerase